MKNIISETNRMKKLMNLPINESDGELDVFPVTGMFDIGWDQELQDKLNNLNFRCFKDIKFLINSNMYSIKFKYFIFDK